MSRVIINSILILFAVGHCFAQDPFEKYPGIEYKTSDDWTVYDKSSKEGKYHYTATVPNFFNNGDTLTLQLTSFVDNWDSSYVRVYRNHQTLRKFFEPMGFSPSNIFEPFLVADINGDELKDIKVVVPYMGNGTAALNVRVIYLFQNQDEGFDKISFDDKMNGNRPERDFNSDGNFEIVTMTLMGYDGHSYWLYNLFNYSNGELKSVNSLYDYPIMIQFLYRENHEITKNISQEKMKEFGHELPEGLDKGQRR